jgi:hypothetical protein
LNHVRALRRRRERRWWWFGGLRVDRWRQKRWRHLDFALRNRLRLQLRSHDSDRIVDRHLDNTFLLIHPRRAVQLRSPRGLKFFALFDPRRGPFVVHVIRFRSPFDPADDDRRENGETNDPESKCA